MSCASSVLNIPTQAPYARHVFICTGTYCDPGGKARHLYRLLAQKLGELGDYANPVRVKRGVTSCLGVCYGGPLLVIYPEGIWYHRVDEAVLDRIVEEHLRQGQPVQEYIFHRLADNQASICGTHAPVHANAPAITTNGAGETEQA
jgi:(2Fe-2S) ferredoxin